ncbi:Serine/threonine kinase [Umbelopsis sp. WA50703]
MDAVRNVIRERVMLEQLDHPFICRLRFAFQDDDYMYMVMDLMMGGNLGFHLMRQKFDEHPIRFWMAELACAIRYLHQERVVHRDIKPDNILLDEEGHAHLSDFNIASHIPTHRPLTSHSGTALYMAPEIFQGGGYNEAVDWWGLGVTMYECVYRKRPFEYEKTDDLQKAILRGNVFYPPKSPPVSPECISVIQGLLEPNPSRRLGQGPAGWAALTHHPFFRSVDWSRLTEKHIKPPFTPPTNQNNFDATHDLEELLFEDNPLSGQPRRNARRNRAKSSSGMSKEVEKYEKEMDYIEERFKPFDFTVFERYVGFQDPIRMTVGEPPEWVKPAFEGAEHGDFLPVKRISTTSQMDGDDIVNTPSPAVSQGIYNDRQWLDNNRTGAGSNYRDTANQDGDQRVPYSGRSMDANVGLTEDHAYYPTRELQKKQSNRSFRERRERDRRSVSRAHNDTRASSSTSQAVETLAEKLREM